MPLPDGPQFKESFMVRGVPVRLLSEQGLGDLVGEKVRVHMHTPAREQLNRPIYSVLNKGRVVGHTDNIFVKNAEMKVDKRELEKNLRNPQSKTRNTFVAGVVSPAPIEKVDQNLKIRPGSMTDESTGEDVSTGMSVVQLGPTGATYRP